MNREWPDGRLALLVVPNSPVFHFELVTSLSEFHASLKFIHSEQDWSGGLLAVANVVGAAERNNPITSSIRLLRRNPLTLLSSLVQPGGEV
jgi:hypothetical protein